MAISTEDADAYIMHLGNVAKGFAYDILPPLVERLVEGLAKINLLKGIGDYVLSQAVQKLILAPASLHMAGIPQTLLRLKVSDLFPAFMGKYTLAELVEWLQEFRPGATKPRSH